MRTIVAKFGGSSLASAVQIKKAADIIHADPARRYVVASAPGKCPEADKKVTDMLYRCYDLAESGADFTAALDEVRQRFADILSGLGLDFALDAEIEIIRAHLAGHPERDYMASRGEYLNSKILAAYLGYAFVDARDYVSFSDKGDLEPLKTYDALGRALAKIDRAVVPGFYGALSDGTIHTFSRGGSDVSGAIVAKAVNADLYENWTDVSGMLVTDPRIVRDPKPIDFITYKELRELSYMGASVMHEDAVFPARRAGIPINIRNTNRPEDPGTMIVSRVPASAEGKVITGIAGGKGFSSVTIEKAMMNGEIGYAAEVLEIFASYGISLEHLPSGIDTLSVIVASRELEPHRQQVMDDIRSIPGADVVSIEDNLAMVAVVGHGMVCTKGTAARIFSALAGANVNIRMIDQGSSELNIILGVNDSDYETAVRAIYEEFEDVL